MNTKYLSPEQVQALNEKHGWFQYGDAQSDVSNAFANDAVALHESIRNAAPALLSDLIEAESTLRRYAALHWAKGTAESDAKAIVNCDPADRLEATIHKATGATK